MPRILKPERFASRDTVKLARDLIGKTLVVSPPDQEAARYRITETEAYDGPQDLACHASKGRTARTAVMFGPAGHWFRLSAAVSYRVSE